MKKLTKLNCFFSAVLVALAALSSCQKNGMTNTATTNANLTAAITANQAILVASASTSLSSSVVATDAIYIIHAYPPGLAKDSVTFASLPATIGTYLTANYAGYTFQKAFKILTASSTVDSYVVVVLFNGKPVGLKFDATGTFVAVLEQCEGHDLGGGPGWHEGGRFGDRDGMGHDTIAVSALPGAVVLYFAKNYPADTLLHAAINLDGSYTVISADKGLFATTVTALGSFIGRVQIYPHPNNHLPVLASALPAAITTYLTATFPGYVFDKAFAENANTTLLGYDVFIVVNSTREAVEFDASGKFVRSIVIR